MEICGLTDGLGVGIGLTVETGFMESLGVCIGLTLIFGEILGGREILGRGDDVEWTKNTWQMIKNENRRMSFLLEAMNEAMKEPLLNYSFFFMTFLLFILFF